MIKIELRNVSTIFGRKPTSILPLLASKLSKNEIHEQHEHVVGLRRISLSVEEGQVFVIMGLSGSGKSTLIRHINRLVDPTEGEILIDGRDILKASAHELQHLRQTKLSMVFQHFGLFPHKSVLDNTAYGLEARGEARAPRRETAKSWISSVGLAGYENKLPSQLSGGMQQRVGLARALAPNPEILLMDEAFSALDPLIRTDMQGMLLDLQRELRKTIVFITHDLDEALAMGDRIAILQDGVLVQQGTPADIILTPANDYVRRFVRNVNRARVLSVRSIMSKDTTGAATPRNGSAVDARDSLEAALSRVVGEDGPVPVFDDAGQICGSTTRKQIVATITGSQGALP